MLADADFRFFLVNSRNRHDATLRQDADTTVFSAI